MNLKSILSLAIASVFAVVVNGQDADIEKLREISPHGEGEAPVLFVGDSMMKVLGIHAEKSFKREKISPCLSFSSIGSGLARPSIFNWNHKIKDLIDANKPKTVFVALGMNDRQPLEAPSGEVIPYSNAEAWTKSYSELVGAVMDQFIDGKAEKVVWFLPPDMKDSASQEHAYLVRKIIIQEALKDERKDIVQIFDMAPILSKTPGKYTQYKMSPTGQSLSVRDPDGVHLSPEGAKEIVKAILKQYWGKGKK